MVVESSGEVTEVALLEMKTIIWGEKMGLSFPKETGILDGLFRNIHKIVFTKK